MLAIGAEPVGKHRTRGPGTDNDVVIGLSRSSPDSVPVKRNCCPPESVAENRGVAMLEFFQVAGHYQTNLTRAAERLSIAFISGHVHFGTYSSPEPQAMQNVRDLCH